MTDRSVSWVWCESGESAPLSKAELSQLRVRLLEIESELRELAESGSRTAANEVLGEVRSAMSALAASLAVKSDAQLAAFAVRTTSGVRVHSWSSLKPPGTRSVRANEPESNNAGLRDAEPGSLGESGGSKHAIETEHLNADRRADLGTVRRENSTQRSAKAKWLWVAVIGVALVALLLASLLMSRERQSKVLAESPVPDVSDDPGGADGAVQQSAIGVAVVDQHEAEDGSGKLEAVHTSSEVRRSFLGERSTVSTETLRAAALPAPKQAEVLSSYSGGGSTQAQGEIAPERPFVLPSVDAAAPVSRGAAISNDSGLPIVSGAGGRSPSVNGAGGSAGASVTEAINGGASVARLTSAELEGNSEGRSLPVVGGGTAPLPATDPSTDAQQASPNARRISNDDNFGKIGRGPASNLTQRSVPTAHRDDALPASGRANAEATSAANVEQKREAAISERGETAVASRMVRIRISPWVFVLTRDTVVSTRPLPVGLTDDSEVRRQALLSERQAHAPRVLSNAELTWGIAFDCPEDVSESDWSMSGYIEGRLVRREGARVLIPLAKGSVAMNGRFQWEGHDSRNVLLSIDADASDGISLAFRDGLHVAVWISAELGNPVERSGGSKTDATRVNANWVTTSALISSLGTAASRVVPQPRLEIPLDSSLSTKSPLRISLLDEESGWAWRSELRTF
ncbi:MAG: hypothetical protein K1X42_15030 [Opitutaceae bacterium]|nr:hypothetical protein [Opitutaceae bacterium]